MRRRIVLLPGLLCDARMWAPQVEALGTSADAWIPDLTRDDSMPLLAQRVLEECPFETFSLAGFSMGGYVAFEIMRQAAQRIERLALLDTQARPDTPEATERRKALIELAERGRFIGVADRLMPLMLASSRIEDPGLTALIRSMAQAVGKDGFLRQQRAIMTRVDSRPMLGEVSCPTLVLCGERDLLIPVDRHEEMANAIPGATLVRIAGAGHMTTIEYPEAVSSALTHWLDFGQ